MSHYKKNEKGELVVDMKELLKPSKNNNVIVKEVNKPNIEKMARAFYDLLYKK